MNMTNGYRSERLIAKRYEEQGYVVAIEPPASAFPFPLGNYKPDILATKGDDKLIIEVKSAGAGSNPDAYFHLDQEVQRHPGWKFLLVTVSDADLQEQASGKTHSVDLAKIQEYLRNIDQVAEKPELAILLLPGLWTAYMSALRLLAWHDGIDGESYSDLSFLNKTYTLGLLSYDEYESSKRLMKLRNHALHNLERLETFGDWKQLRQMVDAMLQRLNVASVPTVPA
jgi:hypothetical protein